MEQKRYESDMTPKEKRELEKKKLKQMTFPQKVEYIWAYYKLHMAIALPGDCICRTADLPESV